MKKFLSVALILCMVLSVVPFYTTEADAATVYTEAEGNDVIGDADPIDITDGATVKGKFTDNYDCDFFKFTIDKGGRVDIKSTAYCDGEHSSIIDCIYYYVYYETDYPKTEEADSGYAYFNSDLGYGYGSKAHYLAEGTYYLKLTGCGTRNLEYNLSIKYEPIEEFSEPNDVIGQATDISIGDKYRGLISAKYDRGRDVDFFRLYSPVSKKYNITVDARASEKNLLISLHDEEGNFLGLFEGKNYYFQDPDCVDAGKKETFTATMPAGDVYIKIIGGEGAEYTISVSAAGSSNTGNNSNNGGNNSDYDNSGNNGSTDDDNTYTEWDIKNMVKNMQLYALSKKTSKKNINITLSRNSDLKLIESLGYSVEYRLYRAAKKPSKFSFRSKKTGNSVFVNTKGKRGTSYYYKIKVVVYDEYGYRVASTKLNQCTYTSRKWTK